jgi:hypothetical protein
LYRLHGNPSRCLIKLSPCPPPPPPPATTTATPRHSIPPSLRDLRPPARPPARPLPLPRCSFWGPRNERTKGLCEAEDTKRWSLPQTFPNNLRIPPTNPLTARTCVHLRAPHSRPPHQEGRQETFNSLFREMKNSGAPRERRPMTVHGAACGNCGTRNGDESESSLFSVGIFRSRGTASSLVIKGADAPR